MVFFYFISANFLYFMFLASIPLWLYMKQYMILGAAEESKLTT